MKAVFLIAALALPPSFFMMPPLLRHPVPDQGQSALTRMLWHENRSKEKVLCVYTPPEWVLAMRRNGIRAWRVTRTPQINWDIVARAEALPFDFGVFTVVYHEQDQRAKGSVTLALSEADQVLADGGFLIFKLETHFFWLEVLRFMDYQELPVKWLGRSIFQKSA